MTIGKIYPCEWKEYVDPDTGRTIKQLTSAIANSYPLYYFIPSITADNRYLIVHSERSGWVQLYRLDLEAGELVQLTDGLTRDSGWAIWCERHLRGIYNHLSALNQTLREVYYFQDDEIRSTHIDTLHNRIIHKMPGRISIGQTGFSEDGKYFAFIHADYEHYNNALSDRSAMENMGQPVNHIKWRSQIPSTVGIIDTETCEYREVIALDYHVHHVFFIGDRLLINHLEDRPGMWTVKLDGSEVTKLRPDAVSDVNHQVITSRGLYYEANQATDDGNIVWAGRYDLETNQYEEVRLPAGMGYVHTGWDPAGNFLFYENQLGAGRHELISLHFPRNPDQYEIRLLKKLAPIQRNQRRHAHPFLSPDRKGLIYTEVIDGFSQVCMLDVADLVDLDEYW